MSKFELDPTNETLMAFVNFMPYFAVAFLFVCCFYISERYLLINDNKTFPKHYVYLSIVLGFTIRVFLAYYAYEYVDVRNTERFAELVYSGENVYSQSGYLLNQLGEKFSLNMPYAPFWIVLLYFWKIISVVTGISFAFLFKFSSIIADAVFIFFLLFSPLKVLKERQNMSLLLALSPVVISVSAVFGQFDLIPTFFSFLAFLLLVNDDKNWKWAALCLGFGIFAKTFPLILLPAFLSQFPSIKKRISFACIAITPITLSLLVAPAIHSTPQDIVNSIISYKGVVGGAHGFSGLFWVSRQAFQFVSQNSNGYEILETIWNLYNHYGTSMVIIFIGIGYFYLFKKVSLLERIVYTYFVFYVFSNAVACQYLVWIIPFMLYGNYTFASGFHFWSNLACFVYIPFTVGGIFHFQMVDKLFPLMMGFLWLYSLYCLILITRNILEKSNDTHQVVIHKTKL